jgi:hypothetical protein
MIKNVTLGADPEFFLYDTKKKMYVSAEGLIGGQKNNPTEIPTGEMILEDNVMVEFCTTICKNAKQLNKSVNNALVHLRQMLPKHLEFRMEASAELDWSLLTSEQATQFGCMPDSNAYTLRQNTSPDSNTNLRTCSGHVHIGFKNPNFDEQEVERRMKDLESRANTSFFDAAERGANKLLKYLYKYHNVKDMVFDPAFEDALICAEQFAFIEELGGEMVIRKGDPTRIFTIMNGYSTTERGLEALVEITYHTVSSIVDMFHDELTYDQIKEIEMYRGMNAGIGPYFTYPMYGHVGELAIPSDSMTAKTQDLMPLGDVGRIYPQPSSSYVLGEIFLLNQPIHWGLRES